MAANGQLPPSQLAPIAPNGHLCKPAAKSWNAFARYCRVKHGVYVQVTDSYRKLGKPGDLNRGVWSQWAAWEKYQRGGNLAARPGTSNHGWGLAVDVPAQTQSAIARWGGPFGWSKQWSDAPSEPWHFRWSAANAQRKVINQWCQVQPGETIRYRDKGPGVVALKKCLRAYGRGYWPYKYPLNRSFGRVTRWWVKKFQKENGLKPDGIVGRATWRKLRKPPKRPAKPKPQPTPKPKPKPKSKLFADISNNNPSFDAKKYAAKYDLIVMKASEGKTFQDPVYIKRARAARKAGLTVYSYHFARPSNNSGRAEAWNFCHQVKKVGPLRKSDRYVLDWEDTNYKSKGDKWIRQFVRECDRQGVPVTIIYSGGWYLPGTISYWPTQADGKTPLRYWHSAYAAKISNVPANAKKHLWAWQFTDGVNGPEPHSMPGIGRCDVNRLV